MASAIRVGTAGWGLPAAVRDAFPPAASNLARYAGRFDAVEINSSFHRPHRRATWERWADSVPPGFRFAVKLPREISHRRRLEDCAEPLARLAGEIAGLGDRRGPLLVQLPPSLAFDAAIADGFFAELAAASPGPAACEPRHPSWFEPAADALLAAHGVARVAADPAAVPAAAEPGGWPGLVYVRLHGFPHVYRSGYDAAARADWAARIVPFAAAAAECWTIFDNTTSGRAAADALAFRAELAGN